MKTLSLAIATTMVFLGSTRFCMADEDVNRVKGLVSRFISESPYCEGNEIYSEAITRVLFFPRSIAKLLAHIILGKHRDFVGDRAEVRVAAVEGLFVDIPVFCSGFERGMAKEEFLLESEVPTLEKIKELLLRELPESDTIIRDAVIQASDKRQELKAFVSHFRR